MAEVPGGGSDPLARALRDEWGALGLMSYHGVGKAHDGETMWRADLAPEDVGKIRALLMLAASELAGLRERLAESRLERVRVYELSPEVAELEAVWERRIDLEHQHVHQLEDAIEALRVERDTAVAVVEAAREVDSFLDPDDKGPPFKYDGKRISTDAEMALLILHDCLNDWLALAAVGGLTAP